MTFDSSSQPVQPQPPLISSAPPIPAPKPGSVREPIAVLLNLCFGLFLADAVVSLMDDTSVLLLNVHFLAGVRGILGAFAMFLALLVYLIIGLTPLVPKRLFLPITLFNPIVLLAAIPAWIYFFGRAQQISWLLSLSEVLFCIFMLWRIQGGFKLRWPLVPLGLVEGKSFSWPNSFVFCLVNLLVVVPGVIAYLVVCSALAVGHFSEGFVALRPAGFTVQVRNYVRQDGKSILLVPMSHIGEPEFYRSLARSFPTNSTILMEGVTDDNNLLTNRITYKRMATTLGLAQQQKEFKPSPVQMVRADVDVDQFSPSTIDFLNLVMLIHSKGITMENLMLMMQSSGSPDFEEQIFKDILRKRNQHLLQEIQDYLPQADGLVVPWGAAHMPEIAREIQKSGFRLQSAREFVAIRFHRR